MTSSFVIRIDRDPVREIKKPRLEARPAVQRGWRHRARALRAVRRRRRMMVDGLLMS